MKQLAKHAAKTLLRRAGYTISGSDHLESSAFAHHLRKLFAELDVSCVLDVGSHIGEYRNFLRHHIGYDGLVISFEPVRKSVEILRSLARNDSQWHVYEFALGSENTTKQINVMKFDGLSSFLKPDDERVDLFKELNALDHTETVEVRTLDSVMEALELRNSPLVSGHDAYNFFLKMDTQGYDLEVVKGAEKAMPGVAALQTELSLQPIYESMPAYKEVLTLLEKRGFDISGVYPVSRDRRQRVIEFDCVMVNRELGT